MPTDTPLPLREILWRTKYCGVQLGFSASASSQLGIFLSTLTLTSTSTSTSTSFRIITNSIKINILLSPISNRMTSLAPARAL
jgi:hypothetical protein